MAERLDTRLEGPSLVQTKVFGDERGFLAETYRREGIAYDDPDLAIAWPEGLELVPSACDARAPRLADVADALPFVYAALIARAG